MSDRVKLTCAGTGDAFGSGGRLNSCYHLDSGEQRILLDCGCSALISLQRCGLNPADLDAIIISHLHGDHFGGIPFLFLEAKFVSQRRRPLTLVGPAGLEQQIAATMEALYPGTMDKGIDFPVTFLKLDPENTLKVDSASVRCCPAIHGNKLDAFALRIDLAGKSLCYSGDTEWTDDLIPLVSGSDLLIAECFAYAEQTPSHLDYRTLLQRRNELGCRRLVLTHLGPEMLAQREHVEFDILNDGDLIVL